MEEEGWRDRDKGNGFRVTDGLAGGHGQGVSKDWTAVAAAPRLGRRPCPTLPCPPPPVCLSLARLTDVSIYPFLNGGECQREEEGAKGRADGRTDAEGVLGLGGGHSRDNNGEEAGGSRSVPRSFDSQKGRNLN